MATPTLVTHKGRRVTREFAAALADAYPAGWTVTHGGTEYVSTQTGNASEPGTTGAAHAVWELLGPA